MFRKIILGIATMALVAVAFAIYVWREEPGATTRKRDLTELRHRTAPTTQPGATSQPVFTYQSKAGQPIRIPPGQAIKFDAYDPRTGEARIAFRAKESNPVADNEFHLTEPFARVLLPGGGQLAYVRADEGQVKFAGGDTKNLAPKSGWFKGHVEIFIDRSKPQWREEHPDQALPEQNPDAVIRIWLDDARFDMDLARLESNANVIVQSPQGTIEGKGLELAWNEAARKLRKLRIVEGKRAIIRNAALGEFGSLPGQATTAPSEESAEPAGDALSAFIQAQPVPSAESQPAPDETAEAPASAPAAPREIGFLDKNKSAPKADRIDTYELVFRDNVVVRQITGLKTVSSLKADTLTILKDVGGTERTAFQYSPGAKGSRRGSATTATAPALADVIHENADHASNAATADGKGKGKSRDRSGDVDSTIEITWTGEVLVEPLTPPTSQETPDPNKVKRSHIKVQGSPVEIVDAKRGSISCRTFEYHMETKQGWLTGSPQEPLVMNAGPDRQVIVDQTLFFDQKNGEIRIDGPGRMLSARRERQAGESTARPAMAATDQLVDASSDMHIAWRDSGHITFEQTDTKAAKNAKPATSPAKSSVYLKSASFVGKVAAAGVAGQSIAADMLDVTFLPPRPKATPEKTDSASPLLGGDVAGGTDPDHLTAVGHVRMARRALSHSREERRLQKQRDMTEVVDCDRLEIEMARNDVGTSYPKVGTAIGHVLARQTTQQYMGAAKVGSPLVRDIRADDRITIEMASLPNPPTEDEIQRAKVEAAKDDTKPDSDKWKKKEAKLRNRRKLVNQRLVAQGNVSATDAQQNLAGLRANTLECSFDDDQKIKKAILIGSPEAPAYVEQNTFYIRGERLTLDMATETVDVPGKGMLRFSSNQDIDGQPVEGKLPVVVTWQRDMWLRGSENTGLFQGNVHVTSANNIMEASEVRLRFVPVANQTAPATAMTAASRPTNEWIVGPLLDLARSRSRERDNASLTLQRERKLARVDAFGDVVIVSSSYRPATETLAGRIDRLITARTPAFLHRPATAPAEPDKTCLLSRIRVEGPQVRIDLADMQLLVEGKGNLLVEDYRMPAGGGRTRAPGADTFLSTSVLPGVDSTGPSQTLFTWQNSMSFLSRDNVATFDRNVTMVHQAGTALANLDRIQALHGMDDTMKKRIGSRVAGLTCGNLVAQFDTAKGRGKKAGPSPLSAATGLKAFWARRGDGDVKLVDRVTNARTNMQRRAVGTMMYYDGQTGEARITGSEQSPAYIEAMDPKTGRPADWRGQEVTWNLKTNEVRLEKSQILAPGR